TPPKVPFSECANGAGQLDYSPASGNPGHDDGEAGLGSRLRVRAFTNLDVHLGVGRSARNIPLRPWGRRGQESNCLFRFARRFRCVCPPGWRVGWWPGPPQRGSVSRWAVEELWVSGLAEPASWGSPRQPTYPQPLHHGPGTGPDERRRATRSDQETGSAAG